MRKFLAGVSSFSLVVTCPGAALAQDPVLATSQGGSQERAFCRTPAPLPDLGRENEGDPQQQRPRVPYPAVSSAPPAPPAVAPSPPARVDREEVVIVTGSRVKSARTPADAPPAPATTASGETVAAPKPMATTPGYSSPPSSPASMPRPPRPVPAPQSGLLTAGEHDDLLNPELYAQ